MKKKLTTYKPAMPIIANMFKQIKKKGDKLIIRGICLVKLIRGYERLDTNKIELETISGKNIRTIKFIFKYGIPMVKGWDLNFYSICFDINDVLKYDIQNKLVPIYRKIYRGRIIYNIFDKKRGRNRNSKVIKISNTSIYLRQSLKNTMYLTVRETNKYDFYQNNLKIIIGFILSRILVKENIILMYEKESSRYEESASVLYEKLIEEGYSNVYFLINQGNPKIKEIDGRYKKNLIYKDSFKHILYFFKAKKFIGTETMGHAMQLRAANKLIVNKIQDKDASYIFLQHGVMYMVSLNAELRSGFRQRKTNPYKVVVSSELEAQHFIKMGGFERKDIYITGLAKFDRSYKYEDADKIIIMLTWRSWESNLAKNDFQSTRYYRLFEKIINGVPKYYKDKLQILPHPLMKRAMLSSKCGIKEFIPKCVSYDEALRYCDVFITDYSSLAYDAFYRGSKVIFYWEEKDECLEHYGENVNLMLDSKNVFGNICLTPEEIAMNIDSIYKKEQSNEHKKRYERIVEFHDGKNTERIFERLKQDGYIN